MPGIPTFGAGGGMSGGPTSSTATATSTSSNSTSVQQGNISFGASKQQTMTMWIVLGVVGVFTALAWAKKGKG